MRKRIVIFAASILSLYLFSILAAALAWHINSNHDAVKVIAVTIAERIQQNESADFHRAAIELIRASLVNGKIRTGKACDTWGNELRYHFNGDEIVVESPGILGLFECFGRSRVNSEPNHAIQPTR